MQKARKLLAIFFILTTVQISTPTPVRATTDGLYTRQIAIMVDDVLFNPWGYTTHMAIAHICLHDMAYMLRGTPSQFNIRTPIDDRWDFWIIRGEAYTPTGTEFSPIPSPRFATRSDGGGLFGWEGNGFEAYPEQTLIIGIDGIYEPASSLAIRTVIDIDNTYFMLCDLAQILGLTHVITTEHWHPGSYHDNFVPGVDHMLTTHTPQDLPIQCPTHVAVLMQVAGQWVDAQHFHSDIIDESIVWPAEIVISYHGVNKPMWNTLAPMPPEWTRSLWEWEFFWRYPVSVHPLENGLMEITVVQPAQARPWHSTLEYTQGEFLSQPLDFYNYRIVVDPQIDHTITLYIGDTAHQMIRYRRGWYPMYIAERYTALPSADGGIMLRYIWGRWGIDSRPNTAVKVYRASQPATTHWLENVRDISGTQLHRQVGIAPNDPIVFEFIDNTVQAGRVYYYSLWRMTAEADGEGGYTYSHISLIGNMRVDVDAVLGKPEVATVQELAPILAEVISTVPGDLQVDTSERIWRWPVFVIIAGVALIALALMRRT